MRLSSSQELLLLILWILLPGPALCLLLSSSLASLPSGGSLELTKVALSTLLIFALPSLFFPVGKEARQALFSQLEHPSSSTLWRLLLWGGGALLLAEGAYTLSLYLGKAFDLEVEDLITQRIRLLLSQGDVSLLLAWVALALTPAVCEELCFRGMLQPLITRVLPASASRQLPWLLTALLFSLLHFSPLGFVSRFILGYTLSYFASETRSLYAPILLHLANNTLALLSL